MLFSSSSSVYALTEDFEVREDSPLAPQSPYARTKWMMEEILVDMAAATDLRAVMSWASWVMAVQGQKDAFTITGVDLPTRDGTGLRD